MPTSVNLDYLPEISFSPQDASETLAEIIASYEKLASTTLQPGDPVRLFLNTLAYRVSVQNGVIDLAGRQNLLAFATGGHLDHLGALMGVARIPAQPSRCILRFRIGQPLDFDLPIPEGTRVSSRDGKIIFATIQTATIAAGAMETTAVAFAETPGQAANGLVPGQLSQLVDPLPYVIEAANASETGAGADIEDDERLRERIRIAPESFTVAGSRGAYEARTLAISQEIEEVAVYSPEPGHVDVRFTLTGGALPDEAMIALVLAGLSDETVRPLTDFVHAGAPDPVAYDVIGKWYLRRSESMLLASTSFKVDRALEKFLLWQRRKPGRDLNPSRLISLVEQAGAKRIALESPVFTPLELVQVAREREVRLEFGGLEDD